MSSRHGTTMSPLRKSPSSARLAALSSSQTTSGNDDEDAVNNSPATVTVAFPSRMFPLAGLCVGVLSIASSVVLNRYHGHEIGGIGWPYISDTAKDMPQAGVFSFGMSVTSVLIGIIVVINYGKIKRDLYRVHGWSSSCVGRRRNKASLVAGLIAAPNLGLLACFDTARSPGLHMLFVLGFFPAMVVYLFTTMSLYADLERATREKKKKTDDDDELFSDRQYYSLRASLYWKRSICCIFLVFVTLYLPVGMYFVTDYYDYAADAAVHTFRAVCQHISVLCLIFYFGTFYFDFGDLNFFIVQA